MMSKSLIAFPNEYIVYDLETSGRSYNYDRIIEFAALKVSNGVIVNKYQSLINPERRISDIVTDKTGITNSMLVNAPTIQEVISEIKSFLGNSILVGHNITSFDNYFLNTVYSQNNLGSFENEFVDTLILARKIYPELDHHRLADIVVHLGIDQDKNFHRALNDCYFTQQCYSKMKETVIQKYGSVAEFGKTFVPVSKTKSSDRSFIRYKNLKTLTTSKTEFDENNPFFKKSCVFTGELEKYSRSEAAQIILDLGGKCENNVTKKTNYLIISADADPNKKSSKQKKAEDYKLKGQDIEIIPENVFYDMIREE